MTAHILNANCNKTVIKARAKDSYLEDSLLAASIQQLQWHQIQMFKKKNYSQEAVLSCGEANKKELKS